ncbi:MAG: YfhO family protein [bacterium]|nr:YfhO family protein [bacterium]
MQNVRRTIDRYFILLVILFYAGLFILFFSPVIFTGRLLAPGDGYMFFIPAYYSARTLWTTLIFGGFPIAADPQNMTWYPLSMFLSLLNNSWNIFIISTYVIASSFTFGLVYSLTKSRLAGLIAGIIYGMNGFLFAHLGHTTMIHTAAWLPGIILCLEKLKPKMHAGWFASVSIVIAMSYLAGFPQLFVYSIGLAGLYVIFTGWHAPVGRWRYYLISLSAVLVGIGLIAVQLLPSIELAKISVRESITYQTFGTYSLKPRDLITLLFPFIFGGISESFYGIPTFIGWGLTESSGYIGILSLILAVFGILLRPKIVEQKFFGFIAVFSLLLVLGNTTPLTKLMFYIPAYNLFRAPARHFLEFSLSISILAGFGTAGIQRVLNKHNKSKLYRSIIIIAGVVFLGYLLIIIFQSYLQGRAQQNIDGTHLSILPWGNPAVGIPLLITIISGLVLFGLVNTHSKIKNILLQGLLVGLIVLDLGSFSWFCEWKYNSPAKQSLIPNKKLLAYKTKLESSHQRMLSVRGAFGTFDELPPNLSKLWEIPSVGGYNPLIMTRISNLLNMAEYGGIDSKTLTKDNAALNIMATRYLFIPMNLVHQNNGRVSNADFIKYDIGWLKDDLGIIMNSYYSSQAQANLVQGTYFATKLVLVTSLSYSPGIPDGTQVLRVVVTTDEDKTFSFPIEAGKNTAEWAYDRKDVKTIVKHKQAQIFDSFPIEDHTFGTFNGHKYLALLPLTGRYQINKIFLEWIPPSAESNVAIAIHKLSLKDESTGTSYPISELRLTTTLADTTYWKPIENIAQTAVYENLRAMPRAWLVPAIITLKPEQILTAIKTSRLPNGTIFNPYQFALVEKPLNFAVNQLDASAKVEVVKEEETSMKLVSYSYSSSFLVVSDVYYPGWKAFVNGKIQPIEQTNYILRGLILEPGKNEIQLVYQPFSFRLGLIISVVTFFLLFGGTIGFSIKSQRKDRREYRLLSLRGTK